jgi:hypothetical protein
MPEDRWMRGKAAASPRSSATWASENAASVYVRGPWKRAAPRNVSVGCGTSRTDRRKKDFANGTLAPQLGSGTAGRLGHRGIASSGRLLDRQSAVRCPESQRERE